MFRRKLPVRPAILGVAVLGLFGFALWVALVSTRSVPLRGYSYATAAFSDVRTLERGDDVRRAGVRIGQVDRIYYEDGQARVRMQLPAGFDVYRDARAELKARSALGQKFVQLHAGSPDAGPLGSAVIPLERTTSTVELDQVLDVLDEPTRESLRSAVRELGAGLGGRGEDLNDLLESGPALLEDLAVASEVLAASDTELAGLLGESERFAGRFAGREATLASLVDRLSTTLDALAVDGGEPVTATLRHLPATIDAVQPALDELSSVAADATVAVRELRGGARALGGATGDVRAVLRDGVTPLERVPGVAKVATPAVRELTPVLREAREPVAKVATGLRRGRPLVEHLGLYAPEIVGFLTRWGNAADVGDANGKWWRFTVNLSPVAAPTTAVVSPVVYPLRCYDAYPEPGRAENPENKLGGCQK